MAILYRPDNIEDFHPTKIVIIGNGAVRNGWDPIIKAIYRSDLYKDIHHLSIKDLRKIIDLIPSQSVHQYNFFRNTLINELSNGISNDNLEIIKNYFFLFFKFIENIGDEYSKQKLVFTKEIEIIKKSITNESGVITLNYDDSVWNYNVNGKACFHNLMYMHGRAIESESLYFPTDNTATDSPISVTRIIEDNSLRKMSEDAIKNKLQLSLNDYGRFLIRRTSDLTREYNLMHRTYINWMESVTEIVIWGLGLNPYDAEFSSIIYHTSRMKKNVKMTVINPSKYTAEKTRILFNVPVSNFTYINPKSLIYRLRNLF